MAKTLFIIPFLFLCFLGHAQTNAFTVKVYGKGQPVILIPGYSCSADVWKETVDHLQATYECHVINIAGYDGVAPIDTPILKTVKNELIAYIDKQQLKKPVLIGHSLGGFLSLWIASSIPDKISKVIVVDGVPAISAMVNPEINYDSLKQSPQCNANAMIEAFKSMPDSNYIYNTMRAMASQVNDTARARQIATWSFKSDRSTLANTLLEISLADLRPELSKISCPVLVMASLYGTEATSNKVMSEQYAMVKNKQIKVANSKHFIMYDVPAWMYKQIDTFLTSK